jgi:hypothetical protein
MAQGKYISEDTQYLLGRAAQILGETPVPDPTDWQSNINALEYAKIESLNPSCSRIVLKNTITVTDASIVTCTGLATTTCTITCPIGGTATPDKYINMMATINLTGVAQTGVVIQFNYLLNDVPIVDPLLTQVTASLVPGSNSVYLFPTNHTYSANTTITLYGALVVSQ